MPKTWQRVPTLPPTTDTTSTSASTIRPRSEVKDEEDTRETSSVTQGGIELVDLGGRVTRQTESSSYSSSSRTAVGRWSVDKRLQGITDDEEDEDGNKDKLEYHEDSDDNNEKGEKVEFRLPCASSHLVKAWSEALRLRQQLGKGRRTPKMKFSHSLQFNAVPDWSAYYIAYSNLKKL